VPPHPDSGLPGHHVDVDHLDDRDHDREHVEHDHAPDLDDQHDRSLDVPHDDHHHEHDGARGRLLTHRCRTLR